MPITIDLPDDQSAILRTSEELSNRDVKVLRRAARKVGIIGQRLKDLGLDDLREQQEADANDEDVDNTETNKKALAILTNLSDDDDNSLDLFQRVCTVVRLVSWTLERPIPANEDEVDDLPRPLYAALTTEAAKLDLNENFGNDPESKVEAMNDPKVGSVSSASSKRRLAAVSS